MDINNVIRTYNYVRGVSICEKCSHTLFKSFQLFMERLYTKNLIVEKQCSLSLVVLNMLLTRISEVIC